LPSTPAKKRKRTGIGRVFYVYLPDRAGTGTPSVLGFALAKWNFPLQSPGEVQLSLYLAQLKAAARIDRGPEQTHRHLTGDPPWNGRALSEVGRDGFYGEKKQFLTGRSEEKNMSHHC